LNICISELDKNETRKFRDLKSVCFIWSDQENIAHLIRNWISLDDVRTPSFSNADQFIVIVLMHWVWPFRCFKIFYNQWLKLFVALHSGKVQKAISIVPKDPCSGGGTLCTPFN
jgi:hypothetical protein